MISKVFQSVEYYRMSDSQRRVRESLVGHHSHDDWPAFDNRLALTYDNNDDDYVRMKDDLELQYCGGKKEKKEIVFDEKTTFSPFYLQVANIYDHFDEDCD